MFKLKQYVVPAASLQVSAESLQVRLDELEYNRLTDSLESDISQLVNVQDFMQLSNNITNHGMESVALMQLAAKTLGVSQGGIASMESLITAPTVSNEAFSDKAKEIGKKILEKLKKLWAWMKSKFTKNNAKTEVVLKQIGTIDKDTIKEISSTGITVNTVSGGTKGQEELLAQKDKVEQEIAKDPKSNIGNLMLGNSKYTYNPLTDTLHVPPHIASWSYSDIGAAVSKYIETVSKLISGKLDPGTEADAIVKLYTEAMLHLSKSSSPTDGKVTLDLLPSAELITVTLPTVVDGVLAQERPASTKEANVATPLSGRSNLTDGLNAVTATLNSVSKLNDLVKSSESQWSGAGASAVDKHFASKLKFLDMVRFTSQAIPSSLISGISDYVSVMKSLEGIISGRTGN